MSSEDHPLPIQPGLAHGVLWDSPAAIPCGKGDASIPGGAGVVGSEVLGKQRDAQGMEVSPSMRMVCGGKPGKGELMLGEKG